MAILGDSATLAPDVLVPSQWRDLHRNHEAPPLQRLQFAVLEDGLRCAGVIGRRTYPPRKRVTPTSTASATDRLRKVGIQQRESIAWMLADDSACGPFSFIALCDALGIDAARLRALVDHHDGDHPHDHHSDHHEHHGDTGTKALEILKITQ